MKIRNDLIGCHVARLSPDGESHEFLQLLRARDDYMGGTWQPVAGVIEPGETAWQAALRELREETGLDPIELFRSALLASFYIPGEAAETDQLFHQVMFLAVVGRGAEIRLNEEHEAYRWIHASDIDTSFMWPEDRRILHHLIDDVLGRGLCAPHVRLELP